MKSPFQTFKEKHNSILIEEQIDLHFEEDEDTEEITQTEHTSYNVKSIQGLDNLTLNIESSDDFTKLDLIINSKPVIFSDYLGGRFGNLVEVELTKISKGFLPSYTAIQPIETKLFYEGKEISISITRKSNKTNIGFIASHLVGIRKTPNRSIAVLNGLTEADTIKLESDTQNILRSVLFDLEYTYGFSYELTNLENLKQANNTIKKQAPRIPLTPINLIYKKYIPELIEYFHMAEKVDHLPFKYICYFHVLEYFMDKSAYSFVSKKIKQILLSPDFHIKSSEYISNAVNIIKNETERNTTDKIKIGRVISEYTQVEAIQKHLSTMQVLDHFQTEHSLVFSKPLKIHAIKFDTDQNFFDSVARRIYAIRCSIVHSNPDFDESKAVPFIPTLKNLDFLRTEIELIKEIARTIISNSAVGL